MRKRKLRRTKHTNETKRIQRTLMNRRKLTLKDYPETKTRDWTKMLNNRKQRRKSVTLRLYSNIYLSYFSSIRDFTFCVITYKIMETVSYLLAFNQSPFVAVHLLSLGRRLPTCTRCVPMFSIALTPSCKW